MTNIFFLPSLPASILCNYLFIFLMCIFPTASLFFTSYFLQQSIFLQLVPCFFILLPSVSRYSLFCREVFFMSDPYPSFLKILLTTVLPLKYFLLLTIFPSAPDHLPIIYVLATYFTCKFSFWIFPLHSMFPFQVFSLLPMFHLQAFFYIVLYPLTYFFFQSIPLPNYFPSRTFP